MDTIQQPTPPPPPAYSKSASARGIFGTKIPSSVAFAVGILLFLLPFSEIKCNQTVFANKSGLGFVMGSDWKAVSNFGDKENTTTKTNKEKEGNTQYFAIAALALAMLGLLLSFSNAKSGGMGGVVTGVLSAGAMIGMMIELKKWFNDSLAKDAINQTQNNTDNFGLDKLGNTLNDIKPTLNFTPWFYVAIIAFLAAAFFSYRRMSAMGKS
ncbi:MAG TPA: hypothetical protein VHD35_10245 [Chitinophagaceae bacterium]|jgi:hypothetical protein|nr:hypothetical protein [Chitinophagaceae bacterium]